MVYTGGAASYVFKEESEIMGTLWGEWCWSKCGMWDVVGFARQIRPSQDVGSQDTTDNENQTIWTTPFLVHPLLPGRKGIRDLSLPLTHGMSCPLLSFHPGACNGSNVSQNSKNGMQLMGLCPNPPTARKPEVCRTGWQKPNNTTSMASWVACWAYSTWFDWDVSQLLNMCAPIMSLGAFKPTAF